MFVRHQISTGLGRFNSLGGKTDTADCYSGIILPNMRTHTHAKNTDCLGRYYTAPAIAEVLVKCLPQRQPTSLLDLGAGAGSLCVAASSKWQELSLITVDSDKQASLTLSDALKESGFVGSHWHVQSDALTTQLPKRIRDELRQQPSIAVCNPPFLTPAWEIHYSEILEDVGFSGCIPAIAQTDTAVLFLAQNFRILGEGGTVGIIVPDSIVSASRYKRFRQDLLNQYDVQQAIRLPRTSFVGTDAQAHILVISKQRPRNEPIILSSLPSAHAKPETLSIDREKAALRLDYAYHTAQDAVRKITLEAVTLELRRGTFNSAEVRASKDFILHTTDISADILGQWSSFKDLTKHCAFGQHQPVIAEAGDILIARVGRNAASKVIGLYRGSVAISDCLYRLRVMPEYRKAVLKSLASTRGQTWLRAHAYGVAASQLSKGDLLQFPV